MLEILTLIRGIVNQIMGLFVKFHKTEEADFDSMETQIRAVVLEIGGQALVTILRVRGTWIYWDRWSDGSYSGWLQRDEGSHCIRHFLC